MEIDFTLLAMGLTALIGIGGTILGVKFQGKYKQALDAMNETATLISLVSTALKGISDAMQDQVLTPEELKTIQKDLTKFSMVLEELRAGLAK